MKLFIAIDLEGISGVVSEADTAREGAAAQRARAHMRADLDAVLEGCAAAGAGEVVDLRRARRRPQPRPGRACRTA